MATVSKSIHIPLAFGKPTLAANEVIVLAGDVGGTKTNLALYAFTGETFRVLEHVHYHSADFNGLTDVLQHFLQQYQKPAVISLGVAGPVIHEKATITNLSWQIDNRDIKTATGVQQVFLINDLEALAYGLAAITNDNIYELRAAKKQVAGNMAVIAPGTGLGEAGLYWDGKQYHPFATEGGHGDFAPRTEMDIELYRYLQQQLGHVSWERLISGQGIVNIYRFLRDVKKMEVPAELSAAMQKEEDAAIISKHAASGTCAICDETMQLFFSYLAVECSNLALKFKATGGVYIGGGIVPQVMNLLKTDVFNNTFLDAGRMRPLLENVPVHILLDDKTALTGAAYYGAYF